MMTRVLVGLGGIIVIALIIGGVVLFDRHSSSDSDTSSTPTPSVAAASTAKCPITPGADTVTTLQSTDQVVGTGTAATASSTVSVKYTGCLSDGTVFDSTDKHGGDPISFPLSGVIAGWTQGIPGMKVGGTRTLVIPGNLAYGANPPAGSGIPANAVLTFQIQLVGVQ